MGFNSYNFGTISRVIRRRERECKRQKLKGIGGEKERQRERDYLDDEKRERVLEKKDCDWRKLDLEVGV